MVALDETPASVADAYDAAAGLYDGWHWSALWDVREVPVVAAVLERCERGLLVDAGCGTGRYRAAARAAGFAYLGLDISAGMLAAGAARLGPSVAENALRRADVRATGVPGAGAAVTLCARTVCHFPALGPVLREFARITRPGGALVVTDLHPAFRIPRTRLPTAHGKVTVATYRRSPEELAAAALRFGFTLAERIDLGRPGDDASFVLRFDRR
jgi:SAM-dependent methyltransferase